MTDEQFQAAKRQLDNESGRGHTRANRKLRRQVEAEERRRYTAGLCKADRLANIRVRRGLSGREKARLGAR